MSKIKPKQSTMPVMIRAVRSFVDLLDEIARQLPGEHSRASTIRFCVRFAALTLRSRKRFKPTTRAMIAEMEL